MAKKAKASPPSASASTPISSGNSFFSLQTLAQLAEADIARLNAITRVGTLVVAVVKLVLRIKSNEGMKRSVRQTKSREITKAKQRKNKQKINAKKPKKPPTAFFYFMEDFRKEFQEQNPDVKSMRDVGKACGDKWKTMTYEEKVQYYDIATEKRAEFDRAMTEYNKKMENGDYEESDEESEYDE